MYMKISFLIILFCFISYTVYSQNTGFKKILRGHEATVLCLDTDTEGKYVCSGSFDTNVILWDYNSGEPIRKYSGLSAGVWNVKISPDNKYLACSSWDNNENASGSSKNCISLLNLESFELVKSFSIEPDRYKTLGCIPELDGSSSNGVRYISYSPDGKKLAAISVRRDLFIWDLTDNFKRREHWFGDTKHILKGISPDWKYLLCSERKRGMVDSCFYFLSMESGQAIASFKHPSKSVNDVYVSNNMKTIASIGGNRITKNEINLWDTETRKLTHTLIGHNNVIRSIDFSSNDKYLVSVGEDNLINLWNVLTGELLATFTEGNNKELTSVTLSPNDNFIITGSQDMAIKYWSIKQFINNE